MPWVDHIPNSNIRQSFQALITDLTSFHAQFCKEKNSRYFSNIADSCRDFLNLINDHKTPGEEMIAGLTNGMNTQLGIIIQNKMGGEHVQDFTRLSNQVTQQITKFRNELQAGIRSANQRAAHTASSVIVSDSTTAATSTTTVMRQALTSVQTAEQLLEQIDALDEVPIKKTCMSIVNRAFAKHKLPTFGGLASAAAAVGSIIPTAVRAAANALGANLEECPISNVTDPRVIVPVALSISALGMFSYSYLKSYPKALPKTAIDPSSELKINIDESQQLDKPLLSSSRSSSSI
jgi:hypothetical protein